MKTLTLLTTALAAMLPAHALAAPPLFPTASIPHWTPPAALPTIYRHFDCGTHATNASTHFLATVKALHHVEPPPAHPLLARLRPRAPTPRIAVPLYIHVVTSLAARASISPTMVAAQAAALNAAYNPYGVAFVLQGVDYTANDAWASIASAADERAMKAQLRQGGYSALNLYFHTDLTGGVLGKCTLPTQVGVGAPREAYVVDGCDLAAQTMPGGGIYAYNLGKTAVHETGHWLGLLHTFEGYSCTGSGDYVGDTPAESQSTDGCPMQPWKNSCKGVRPGVDPIRNYMDYSTDACYVRFTQGQMARVRTLWALYRQGK